MSNSTTPSPMLNRWKPTVVFLLAALGVPAVGASFFTHFVTAHPLLATIVGIAYEFVLVVIGFVGKVWGKLESRWVDRIAEWFDHWVLRVFSRYRKTYSEYIVYQHRDFDVKGLSTQGSFTFELGDVFIELTINPTTLQDMSANPIQVPKALVEGRHSIWDYLASISLAKQNLVITGSPGSGKTTLLKHVALTLVDRRKWHRHKHVTLPHKLPILLFLPRVARKPLTSSHGDEWQQTLDIFHFNRIMHTCLKTFSIGCTQPRNNSTCLRQHLKSADGCITTCLRTAKVRMSKRARV